MFLNIFFVQNKQALAMNVLGHEHTYTYMFMTIHCHKIYVQYMVVNVHSPERAMNTTVI